MTIKGILKKYRDIEIELLLAHMLKKPKEFIFLHPETILSTLHYKKVMQCVRRRQKSEPVAYILGYKDFLGLRFKVSRDVLIPRPETEWVVDRIMNQELEIKNGEPLQILDLGTGSGCIIISLAKLLSPKRLDLNPSFYASDISKKALMVARQNAKAHHVKIKFIQSDLLEKIKINPDIIIANLPYGWSEWKNNTSAETKGLKFEPREALFTKDRGLYHINRLLKQVAQRKNKPIIIYLEFDPRQKTELAKNIKKYLPEGDAKFHKDFNGFWRYVEIAL